MVPTDKNTFLEMEISKELLSDYGINLKIA